MKPTDLSARFLYAVVALPAGFAAGFYATAYLLPLIAPHLRVASPPAESEDLFRLALSVGAIVAVPAGLCALTLPWRRRRHRRGRTWRLAVSAAIVIGASLVFAEAEHTFLEDMLFATWLGLMLALTFVRYGLVDHKSSRVMADSAEQSKD